MNNYQIREMQPKDAEKLLAYIKRTGRESDNLSFGPEGLPITVEQEQSMLQAKIDDHKSVIYGVWCDDELIAEGSINALPRRMSHRADLGITVIKEMWNQGIGSMLLNRLVEHAKTAGIEIINLEVRSDNAAAIHLYEKFGFKRIGTFPAYFKIGENYFDFEIMYLDLR